MFTNYLKANAFGVLAIIVAMIAAVLGFDLAHASEAGLILAGAGSLDVSGLEDLLKSQGSAFEAFRKQNDLKLKELDRALLDIEKKSNRIGGQYSGGGGGGSIEAKADLANWIRSNGETKATLMTVGTDPAGGYTVHPALMDGIGSTIRQNSVLRELVDFVTIEAGNEYVEVITPGSVGASWVGESSSRAATSTPDLKRVSTKLYEQYCNPTISQQLVDDSSTNMIDFLTREAGIAFAEAEETALFSGTGVGQPMGLLSHSTAATADSSRAWGVLEHVVTGVSGGFPAVADGNLDPIKEVFYKLRTGYRRSAVWIMNSDTAAALSKLVTETNTSKYTWSDQTQDMGPTLMGRPIVICESAPAIAANSYSIWFGDFKAGLRAIERPGFKVLLDPYSDKPNVQVYCYRRMGLQLRDSLAIKALKFST